MSELTKEASEARDLAVRRALELLYRDDLFFIPTDERPVAETLEECAAVLHYVMNHIYTNAFGFNELVHIPSEHDYRNGVAQLEALTAAPWEGTPENLCLRALAMRSIATARKRLGDVNGSLAALREAAKLAANAGPELQVERCHILRRLSDILSERGEMEESTTLAMEAARLAATVRPEELREGCDILRLLSEILSKNGELGKSTILATEAAKLITTIRPEELELGCFILRDLSEILSKNGALAESLNVAVSAVEIAERIDRASGEAYYHRIPELPVALLQLAEVHHQRGNWKLQRQLCSVPRLSGRRSLLRGQKRTWVPTSTSSPVSAKIWETLREASPYTSRPWLFGATRWRNSRWTSPRISTSWP